MKGIDGPFAVREAALRLEELTGILFHDKTLDGLFREYAEKTRGDILVRVRSSPALYRLTYRRPS